MKKEGDVEVTCILFATMGFDIDMGGGGGGSSRRRRSEVELQFLRCGVRHISTKEERV
jgi:hypothetical protein